MTIARDHLTGDVVGQVPTALQDTPGLKPDEILLLDLNGYKVVPRSSVRLEELR